MEQQQLPLIEAADRTIDPTDASSPGSTASTTAAAAAASGTQSRRKGGRTPGSTRPAKGSPATDWRLDEHTREVGREGVAAARALLNRANRAA
jgi:hypothetical protein